MLSDDDIVGYCRICGGRVTQQTTRGYRPYMARFAEPDEVILRCEYCGEVDEVSEEGDNDG